MSSPPLASSVNNSQGPETGEENDTPTTTPPEAISGTTTPVPEVQMMESGESNNQQENNGHEGLNEPEKMEEDAPEDEEDEDSDNEMLTLPLSKIKKIFKMDSTYQGASNTAVYATGLATELFVRYLTEHASVLAKMEKRKKVLYKDFANAVAGHETLAFLSQTIPKTQPVETLIKEKKINVSKEDRERVVEIEKQPNRFEEKQAAEAKKPVLPKNQQVLNFPSANNVNKTIASDSVTGGEGNQSSSQRSNQLEVIMAD